MEKKKLLVFCPGYPSFDRPTNGIFTQRSVIELCKNFEVEVIHLRAFKFGRKLISNEVINGVRVKRISIIQIPNFGSSRIVFLNSYIYSLILPFLLKRSFLESFDYFHSTSLFPTSVIVAKTAKKLGKKHIAQGIGNDINYYLRDLVKYRWVSQSFRAIDSFQLNSRQLEKRLRSIFPDKRDSFVLYRGVDLEVFRLKRPEDIDRKKIRFLFLGGIQDSKNLFSERNYKGIHVLLGAWQLVERQIENSLLLIGGPGCKKEIFKDWISTISLPDQISIIETILPANIPQLLMNVEVVIIPSLYEGLPNLANEAQATGTLVIAANVGGIPETVKDGYSGYLFKVGDSEDLANKILHVFRNYNNICCFGENGRRNIEENFSWRYYANNLEKKFKELE